MEKVPDEVKPMLTDWMMGQKQKMRALSKQLGKLSYKKTSPEYIALEKEFNILKNSFTLFKTSNFEFNVFCSIGLISL